MGRRAWKATIVNRFRDLLGTSPQKQIRLPEIPASDARAVVVSFYMHNIPDDVVLAQRRLFRRFVPPNVAVKQLLTRTSHADAITRFVNTHRYRTFVIMDIDCVPINAHVLDDVIAAAEAGCLVGAAQRSNHIANGGHIYAAPCCMAFSAETFEALQPVGFQTTSRADVAEEVTYAAEEKGLPVKLLLPVRSDDDVWELMDGKRYGHGTTYEGGLWHAFEIRMKQQQDRFIARCLEVERNADA